MEPSHYAPMIDKMVWSYSRLKAFHDCPYRWYLKYIRHLDGVSGFFAEYGSFLHKLIELYITGERTKDELCDGYLSGFRCAVPSPAPNENIFAGYFKSGLSYLEGIKPFPFTPLSVEEKMDFTVDGLPFTGYMDLLGERDGGLYVVDHKSRALRPRSGRAVPTKTDRELDEYLLQLYLYAAAVEEKYGRKPKALCFNCFRTNTFIEEPFLDDAYARAKKWLFDTVEEIRASREFRPDIEYFKCAHLCEMREACEYYALSKKR